MVGISFELLCNRYAIEPVFHAGGVITATVIDAHWLMGNYESWVQTLRFESNADADAAFHGHENKNGNFLRPT